MDDRNREAAEMHRIHDSEVARIEQSNDISGLIADHSKGWVVLDDRFAIADALWAAGYRLTRAEHVHVASYSAQPGGSMDFEGIQKLVESLPATHRRRVYSGPWEPVPEGETPRADGVTYSYNGQP